MEGDDAEAVLVGVLERVVQRHRQQAVRVAEQSLQWRGGVPQLELMEEKVVVLDAVIRRVEFLVSQQAVEEDLVVLLQGPAELSVPLGHWDRIRLRTTRKKEDHRRVHLEMT